MDRAVLEEVKKYVDFEEIHYTYAGCTVCGHCGPETLRRPLHAKAALNRGLMRKPKKRKPSSVFPLFRNKRKRGINAA